MNAQKSKLFHLVVYGCLGIACEVLFTATKTLVLNINSWSEFLDLRGQSYVWMFPIYGSAAWLIPLFYSKISKYPAIMRPIIFALGIWTVEFITGFILEKVLGACPWYYESNWSILGFVHLGYFPFWVLFGWILEKLHLVLNDE